MDFKGLRDDFPLFKGKDKDLVYLDTACMALKPKPVIDKIMEYYTQYPGCHGRSLHRIATRVTEAVIQTREKVSNFIGAKENEIIFTRNSTEGLNLLAYGLKLERGSTIIGTDKEHNSNLVPWLYKAEREGLRYQVVPSSSEGKFDMEAYKDAVKGAQLVSMVHTSNMDGTTIPAKEIIEEAHDSGALVILDAAQSVPHRKVNVNELDADFLVFSGHKMMGPTGTGVLYGKAELLKKLRPFMVGGGMVKYTDYDSFSLLQPPSRFEAGLQNYAGIAGLEAAVNYLERIPKDEIVEHEKDLNKLLSEGLSQYDGLKIIGPQEAEERGSIVSFYIDGFNPQDIAIYLDEFWKIEIRSGMHCVHSWFRSHGLRGSARASLYIYNTPQEMRKLIDAVGEFLKSFRRFL